MLRNRKFQGFDDLFHISGQFQPGWVLGNTHSQTYSPGPPAPVPSGASYGESAMSTLQFHTQSASPQMCHGAEDSKYTGKLVWQLIFDIASDLLTLRTFLQIYRTK